MKKLRLLLMISIFFTLIGCGDSDNDKKGGIEISEGNETNGGTGVEDIGGSENVIPFQPQNGMFLHDRQTNQTLPISINFPDTPPDHRRVFPRSSSANGQWVAFASEANNLVPNDINDSSDVFIYNLQTGEIRLISKSSAGVQGNATSWEPSISGDGQLIAFASEASNLVPNDINDSSDVFIYNLQTGEIRLISKSSAGVQGDATSWEPSISGDGQLVAFASYASNLVSDDTNDSPDVFVYDLQTGEIRLISKSSAGVQGNDYSWQPSISGNGRWVAFASYASNLVSEDDTNRSSDVFVYDLQTGGIFRVRNSSGPQNGEGNRGSSKPSISEDGQMISFVSSSTNFVPDDTNGVQDVFVYDVRDKKIFRVSKSSDGTQGNDISGRASISGDGRWVVFRSFASNLVANDTNASPDVFVRDLRTGETVRVSKNSAGIEGNSGSGDSSDPSISGDGQLIAFASEASNLAANDTNNSSDVFIHDLRNGITSLVSGNSPDEMAYGSSLNPAVSGNGQFIIFDFIPPQK